MDPNGEWCVMSYLVTSGMHCLLTSVGGFNSAGKGFDVPLSKQNSDFCVTRHQFIMHNVNLKTKLSNVLCRVVARNISNRCRDWGFPRQGVMGQHPHMTEDRPTNGGPSQPTAYWLDRYWLLSVMVVLYWYSYYSEPSKNRSQCNLLKVSGNPQHGTVLIIEHCTTSLIRIYISVYIRAI